MRRIVVTGMGTVSPLGCGVEANWSRLIAGRSGIRSLPEAACTDLPCKVAGLVPDTTDDYARASSARSIVEFHRDLERTDPDRAKLLTVLVAELAEPQAHDYMATNDVRRINRRRVARKAGVTASRLNDQLDLLGRSAIRSGFAA